MFFEIGKKSVTVVKEQPKEIVKLMTNFFRRGTALSKNLLQRTIKISECVFAFGRSIRLEILALLDGIVHFSAFF